MKFTFRIACFLGLLLGAFQVPAQDLLTTQASLPCLDKEFTIVAHIVRDSFGNANIEEDRILESIDTLNQYFSPICTSFEICEFNYIDNFQYDTLETDRDEWTEMITKFNRVRRINMYFVAAQEDNPLCGFASLNGIAMDSRNVGVLIIKDCATSTGTTIPHEMGHFFNLLHTFEGAEGSEPPINPELVDGSNCDTAGDLVCDTPADPYVPGDPIADYIDLTNDCRFINRKRDGNGDFFVPDVANVMSYYPSRCICGFTYGQYLRMANAYLAASEKLW